MRVITFVTQKGGTGKSTLSTNLAVAAMQAGEKVLAIDIDEQGTLAGWAQIRKQPAPAVAHIGVRDRARLPEILEGAAATYSLVIIDTPGRDSPGAHNAMSAANLCLVPLRPTRPDGLAVTPTVQALLQGRRPFAFVLNQCPTTSKSTRASEMAGGLASLGLLADPMIGQRADFQDAFAAGQGVTEYAPEGKAADEIRGLWRWVDSNAKPKETGPLGLVTPTQPKKSTEATKKGSGPDATSAHTAPKEPTPAKAREAATVAMSASKAIKTGMVEFIGPMPPRMFDPPSVYPVKPLGVVSATFYPPDFYETKSPKKA
jgi:chromosome partitioning protein